MRSYHLLILLLSSSLYACTPEQPSPTVEHTTHSVTLADNVTIDDITKENFSSPELETVRLGVLSGGNVVLTESEYTRLKEYAEVIKGAPDADPSVTTFLGQIRY